MAEGITTLLHKHLLGDAVLAVSTALPSYVFKGTQALIAHQARSVDPIKALSGSCNSRRDAVCRKFGLEVVHHCPIHRLYLLTIQSLSSRLMFPGFSFVGKEPVRTLCVAYIITKVVQSVKGGWPFALFSPHPPALGTYLRTI